MKHHKDDISIDLTAERNIDYLRLKINHYEDTIIRHLNYILHPPVRTGRKTEIELFYDSLPELNYMAEKVSELKKEMEEIECNAKNRSGHHS